MPHRTMGPTVTLSGCFAGLTALAGMGEVLLEMGLFALGVARHLGGGQVIRVTINFTKPVSQHLANAPLGSIDAS